MRIVLVASVVLIAWQTLAAGVAIAEEKTKLRWDFQQGAKLNLRVTQRNKLRFESAGTPVESDVSSSLDAVWRVKSVDPEGLATIEMKFQRVRFQYEVAGAEPVSLDTEATDDLSDAEQAYLEQLTPLLSTVVTLRMGPRGRVRSWAISGGRAPAIVDPNLRRSGLSLRDLETLFRNHLPVFPSPGGANDGTWTTSRVEEHRQLKAEFQKDFKVHQRNVDEKAEGDVRISMTGNLELQKESPLEDSSSHVTAPLEGAVVFDSNRGRCERVEASLKIAFPPGFSSSSR